MSIQVIDTSNGLVTVEVSGKFTLEDQNTFHSCLLKCIQESGRVDVLAIATGFEGWEEDDWSDVASQVQHDKFIRRIALVGEEKWRDFAVMFTGKGLRRVEIELFPTEEQARAWLSTATGDK